MSNVRQDWIAHFAREHHLSEEHQFQCLVEELGELAETYATDATDERVAEELADIVFVARTLADARDIQLTGVVNETALENLGKDRTTEGSKVTKQGSASESSKLRPASEVLDTDETGPATTMLDHWDTEVGGDGND